MCEGSGHSRCSQACCLLGEHLKSTSPHSKPGTLVYPVVASGSLKDVEKERVRHEEKEKTCLFKQLVLFSFTRKLFHRASKLFLGGPPRRIFSNSLFLCLVLLC